MEALEKAIQFFESKPDDKWTVFQLNDPDDHSICCAGGHLLNAGYDRSDNDITKAFENCNLTRLIPPDKPWAGLFQDLEKNWGKIVAINNGTTAEYQQDHPKKRILAALYDLKEQQKAVEEVNNIVNVKEEEYATV